MANTREPRLTLELLAPARDGECGAAALSCGADAVYIGGPAFSARSQAGNSVADIERLARLAHSYNARVYVALNTLLREEELPEARAVARQVEEAGADALIIQDMAVAEFGLSIPLHASTQCDNRTAEKVGFLERCGFSQVVLARELTIAQIGEIAAKTDVRLECFVHGALCVSYSGLCNLSRALTGRSANRGNCSQPCRLPCSLYDPAGRKIAGESHLLSLRDMNRSDRLGELAAAGVSSFKIEGRLKDLSYVKNVTSFYRMKLDSLLAENPTLKRASSGHSKIAFQPDPSKSFNRGFTPYLLDRGREGTTAFSSPKSVGEEVGKVVSAGKDRLVVETTATFGNGDGLAYFDGRGKMTGLRVNRAEGTTIYPALPFVAPGVGTALYRNHNEAFDKLLALPVKRTLKVRISFGETAGGFSLTMTDEDGFRSRASAELQKTPAKDSSRSLETLREQLAKLGGTVFEAEDIKTNLSAPWFLPLSSINALRREASDGLLLARFRGYVRETRKKEERPPAVWPGAKADGAANVLNSLARAFYARHGVESFDQPWESRTGEPDVPLMIAKHCLRDSFGLCAKSKGAANAPPLKLKLGNRYFDLAFDCGKCEMLVYAPCLGAC